MKKNILQNEKAEGSLAVILLIIGVFIAVVLWGALTPSFTQIHDIVLTTDVGADAGHPDYQDYTLMTPFVLGVASLSGLIIIIALVINFMVEVKTAGKG